MRQRVVISLIFAFSAFALLGCVDQGVVLPEGNNHYQAMSSGATKLQAYANTEKEASTCCKQERKKLKVLRKYVEVHNVKADQNKSLSLTHSFMDMVNPETYDATMDFSCV